VIPAEIGWSDIAPGAPYMGCFWTKTPLTETCSSHRLRPGRERQPHLLPWKNCRADRRARPDRRGYTDALLVCPRDRAQDVGKIVKWLEEQRRKDLL